MPQAPEFDYIQIFLAGPDEILRWSYGEILKPETINYRNQKPEKDGLFCQRIFGPVKNWECACGKYKSIRYKGVICDKCGVEVTRSIVRRERMGHIRLAAPVAHVWYSRGVPNYMAMFLGISPRSLERVLYYAQFVVISVDNGAKKAAASNLADQEKDTIERLQEELSDKTSALEERYKKQVDDFLALNKDATAQDRKIVAESSKEALAREQEDLKTLYDKKIEEITEEYKTLRFGLERLEPLQLLLESTYQKYNHAFPEVFKAGMGASAIIELIRQIDLPALSKSLWKEVKKSSGQRRKKIIKRLEIVEGYHENNIDPANMIFSVLPVLPADLRPMVQLSGGRFAASDLNDLYRRVINRNNRLKKLIKLNAPEIIIRNEKRMLQEAVDALIDNSAKNRKVVMAMGKKKQKLKSLSDILRGKQGRFRQNLLGKRVDYSGRAVIVVGPELGLDQVGLPRKMAIELFKPFILRDLIKNGFASTLKSANRLIERLTPAVFDVLEKIVQVYPVLLNRAPTLHRLGIQGFHPVLTDGSAIRLHPLVCSAFNADFDGDQMAVYVPLSDLAKQEVEDLMMACKNVLVPASGRPTIGPTLDMVLGLYYLTMEKKAETKKQPRIFSSVEEVLRFYDQKSIALHENIRIPIRGEIITTTVGRVIFSQIVPQNVEKFYNETLTKKKLGAILSEVFMCCTPLETSGFANAIKNLGFRFATKSGITMAVSDVAVPKSKGELLLQADTKAAEIEKQYHRGLITENERYTHTINLWTSVTAQVTQAMIKNFDAEDDVFVMMHSGARGSIEQMRQLAGMRGLMADPSGRIIDLPIKANFLEGLSVLEYFISTHGARKGRADTALRTADSGYLTRRLIDVAQSVVTNEEDCGATTGRLVVFKRDEANKIIGVPLIQTVLGRFLSSDVVDPKTGEILAKAGDFALQDTIDAIAASNVTSVIVRSPINCEAKTGVCSTCYGMDLATGQVVKQSEAVGIIAAQSIGEPGTQLTMRNFHTGGVAGELDITQGLPRVEELFEARSPKGESPLAEIEGQVAIQDSPEGKVIMVSRVEEGEETYQLPDGFVPIVKKGEAVKKEGTILAEYPGTEQKVRATSAGSIVSVSGTTVVMSFKRTRSKNYIVPYNANVLVTEGETVPAGKQLIEGSVNPHALLRVLGENAAMNYLITEIQDIYHSQGVITNTKHIEVIVRQMFDKVRIENAGDTELVLKELIDRRTLEKINEQTAKKGGKIAKGSSLMGITKAALAVDSFLSAASFQETIKILSKAAIRGQKDQLSGLKENLIIGQLIPVGPWMRARTTFLAQQDALPDVPAETTTEPIPEA